MSLPCLPFFAVFTFFAIAPLHAQSLPTTATPPAPPSATVTYDAVVSLEKTSRFKTLQDAVDAAPENATKPNVIFIKAGRYRWQQTIIPKTKPFIHLVGEDAKTTILSYHLNVFEVLKEHWVKGVEGTGVVVQSDNFSARNLTFENTAGDHGQALALRIDGDRAVVRDCLLLGWQDTLFINNGRHYFTNCHIEGRVDFIYGSATAVFDRCVIHSKAGGFVTAASTPQEKPFGFVFLHCHLTGDPTTWEPGGMSRPAELGRPWRPYAAVAFIACELGDHIKPTGWNNWGRPENEKTARYSEYQSTGPGAPPTARVAWSRQLTDDEAKSYTVENILAGSDHWDPAAP